MLHTTAVEVLFGVGSLTRHYKNAADSEAMLGVRECYLDDMTHD